MPPRPAAGKGRVATVQAGRPIRSVAANAGYTLGEMLVARAILGLDAGVASISPVSQRPGGRAGSFGSGDQAGGTGEAADVASR